MNDYKKAQKESGLKVGDRVKVTAISFCGDRGWPLGWAENPMDKAVGKEATIIKMDATRGVNLDILLTHWFPYFVLEKVEEDKMEYEPRKKAITIENLIKEEMCKDWKNKIIRLFGRKYGYTEIIPLKEAVAFAENHGEVDWLIENGFIIKTNKETTYSIGQFFELDNEIYILAQVDRFHCALISVEDGNRFHTPHNVKTVRAITQTEFDKIKDKQKGFVPIKATIIIREE